MGETPHILVVEDEEILQKFLVYHLEHAGYKVTATTSGISIFEILDRDRPDLILLDLGVPDGDGLSRAQQIRERSNVPIIVLTARQGTDDKLLALGIGADDYLTKPCDPRELLLRIRNQVTRQGMAAAAQAAPSVSVPSAPELAAIPGPSSPPSANRGDLGVPISSVLSFGALALLLGGGLVWWTIHQTQLSPPAPQPKQALSSPQTSAPKDTHPASPAAALPAPTPKPPANAFEETVTSTPSKSADTVTPDRNSQARSQTGSALRAAAQSYSWALKSKCPKLPQSENWRFKEHTDLVRYVNRQFGGDWQRYIQTWVDRLAQLQEIYSRNSGVKLRSSEILRGESLKAYIEQTQQRLDVTLCLSREASDFAHRKSLQQR